MWAFIVSVVPLVLLIFQEFFSARARARKANEEFVLSQTELKALVDAAVTKWHSGNAKDSGDAGKTWDEIDKS